MIIYMFTLIHPIKIRTTSIYISRCCISNNFNWEFIRSAPADYLPGYMPHDLKAIRAVQSAVTTTLDAKHGTGHFTSQSLLGFSMGGWTAVELATISDARLSRLILVDSVGVKVGGREDLGAEQPVAESGHEPGRGKGLRGNARGGIARRSEGSAECVVRGGGGDS